MEQSSTQEKGSSAATGQQAKASTEKVYAGKVESSEKDRADTNEFKKGEESKKEMT